MFQASTSRLDILKDRAQMLHEVRAFFHTRNILEVDCPLLCQSPANDSYITPMQTKEGRFLHTSPEYGMKRLLCEGLGDCFQLSHVFRQAECGSRHNPEFTMLEWYRLGFSLEEMIEETLALARVFMPGSVQMLTYEELFEQYAGINPYNCRLEDLKAPSSSFEESLHYVLATVIEPQLPQSTFTVVYDFPESQCALAQIQEGVAKRFEIYYGEVELANGYLELEDKEEHLIRFETLNKTREVPLPIDKRFLAALEHGLPSCCGVAVGFDRLMMSRHHTKEIVDILPFSWGTA